MTWEWLKLPLPIADAHVDVLYKLVFDDELTFAGNSSLQASFARLHASHVKTQVFALFVPAELPSPSQLELVLKSIDKFRNEVVAATDYQVSPVTGLRTLAKAREGNKIAGILSVEGGGCLNGDLALLRILFSLGVRGMGLTWNPANALADGCREPRNGGLTAAGTAVVKEMARLGMWVDIAHLADSGVKDVFSLTDGPIMASHANARRVHEHPRNLTDDTIRELIRREGWLGLTFEGAFVSEPADLSVDALLHHLDYVLELGGEDCVGFGSDFDGTTNFIPGLAHAGDYVPLRDVMLSRYGRALTEKILFRNFERFLTLVLPAD